MNTPKPNKFFAKKVEVNGEKYDSKFEHRYHLQLQADPRVRSIKRQVTYTLQDGFRNRQGKWIRPITYIADYVVEYHGDPQTYVIDTKSPYTKTPDYRIKAKLFQHRYPDLIFLEVMDDGQKARRHVQPVHEADRVRDKELPPPKERARRSRSRHNVAFDKLPD